MMTRSEFQRLADGARTVAKENGKTVACAWCGPDTLPDDVRATVRNNPDKVYGLCGVPLKVTDDPMNRGLVLFEET